MSELVELPKLPEESQQKGLPTQRILAALDWDVVAAAVLDTAARVAAMTGARIEAVHAGTSVPDTLVKLAEQKGVALRLLAEPAGRALVEELERPELHAIVMGAGRSPSGRHPVGPTTRYVAARSTKPVVVVPAEASRAGHPMRRLLVPLEGTESSSRPVLEALLPLLSPDIEVDVLHVFTDATLPRMLDRPVRDTELLGREFLAKHCPPAKGILLRAGSVADRVREACEERGADMIVLSWSQVSDTGRARVVRRVLRSSPIPVLLFPAAGDIGRTALPETSRRESV